MIGPIGFNKIDTCGFDFECPLNLATFLQGVILIKWTKKAIRSKSKLQTLLNIILTIWGHLKAMAIMGSCT